MNHTEYRVYEPNGGYWVTEYDDESEAEERAAELDAEHGEPTGWYVEEHTEIAL